MGDKGNIFADIPAQLPEELFDVILQSGTLKIERIVSKGHASPANGWYDQNQCEWVIVLKGEAVVSFKDGEDKRLCVGDYVNIPAHVEHKVSWTAPDVETVWLAIHFE